MSRSYEKVANELPSYADSSPARIKAGPTNLNWLRWLFLALFSILLFTHHSCNPLHPSPIPALSSEFISNCHKLLEAPSGIYTERIHRLSNTLKNDEVWIAEPGTSAEYLLGGFSSRDWWLSERPLLVLISGGTPNITILTAKFEQSRAELVDLPEEVRDRTTFVPWLESESPYEVLATYFSDGGSDKKRVVWDGQVRSFVVSGLKHVGWEDASEEVVESVKELRERKDEREIGLLRCANQMTLYAIKKTRSRMHIGIPESRTHKILNEEMLKVGLVDGDGLVLFGEDAATPHGEGSDRRLRKEDLILIDAGGKWGGYTADVTRTFSLPGSKIPHAHVEVWETVRKAQYSAYTTLIRSSSPHFAELDAAARDTITAFIDPSRNVNADKISPDYSVFTTRLGHGIGLDGHESPYVNQGPQGLREVKSGHVFSLEPGIYVPGDMKVRGLSGVGVRLEDCFVVTEKDGKLDGEWLTGPVTEWGDI